MKTLDQITFPGRRHRNSLLRRNRRAAIDDIFSAQDRVEIQRELRQLERIQERLVSNSLSVLENLCVISNRKLPDDASSTDALKKVIEDVRVLIQQSRVLVLAQQERSLRNRGQTFRVNLQNIAASATTDPLAAARQRGMDYAMQEWQRADNLPLIEAARYCGRSDYTVNVERQQSKLYALVLPGRERGFRYPQWQFDVDKSRLTATLSALAEMDVTNSWVIHNFLTRPNAELGGIAPANLIGDESAVLEPLLQLIRQTFAKDE